MDAGARRAEEMGGAGSLPSPAFLDVQRTNHLWAKAYPAVNAGSIGRSSSREVANGA